MTPEDTLRFVIRASRDVESILEDKFGATGPGLPSKAAALADVLGESVAEQIRLLAEMRDELEHANELGDADATLARFELTQREVMRALDAAEPVRGVAEKRRRAREKSRANRQGRPTARVSRSRVTPLIAIGIVAAVAYLLAASRRSSVQRSAPSAAPFGATTAR